MNKKKHPDKSAHTADEDQQDQTARSRGQARGQELKISRNDLWNEKGIGFEPESSVFSLRKK